MNPGKDGRPQREFLTKVPVDPYATTRAVLGYHRENTHRARLWSVGRNGTNENGSFEHIPRLGPADLGYSFGPGKE